MDSIANDGKTRLVFEAQVTGAKPVLAKKDAYGASANGRLELTLTLDQPKAPRPPFAPTPSYNWRASSGPGMQPRPGDIAKKKDESDEDYAERDAVKRRVAEQKDWDKAARQFGEALTRYEQEKAAFEVQAAAHMGRIMSYAQLIGIVSVFGNTPVLVEITPLAQDMLPGFSVGLLPEPTEGE